MKPEFIFTCVLGFGALMIVVLNDWWKQRLVNKARGQRKTIRKDLHNNKTQWGMVVVLAIGFALFAYLKSNPELIDRDFGPLNPMVEWYFKDPPEPASKSR